MSGLPSSLTAAQTRDVYYGYDLRNQLLYARFDSASGEGVGNYYDGLGRLTFHGTIMGGVNRTLYNIYDNASRRIIVMHPDGQWFGTGYDALGRAYYLHANGVTGIAYTYFTTLGQPYVVDRGTGYTAYNYDAVQRPTVAVQSVAGANAVRTYAWNPASQLISETRDNDAFAWTGHVNANSPYQVNGLNQYTSVGAAPGSIAYSYDDNGNLIGNSLNGSVTEAWVYDVENRLVSVSGAHNATLSYDPLGRLWQVTSGGATRTFLYDGDALVAEYNAAGAVVRRHVHNVGADVPMITYEGSDLSNPRWLYADRQGSIVASAGMDGMPTINRYDEYGIPAATNTGTFGYTGQVWLPEIGLYHYKARVYSPTLGRFLQTDPVGYEGGNNLYGYVRDDPVNATDPSGNCVEDLCIGEGAVAACLASQACTTAAVVVGSGIVYYGGRFLSALGNAMSGSSADSHDIGRGGDGRPLPQNHNQGPPEFTDVPGAPPFQGEPGSTVRGVRGVRGQQNLWIGWLSRD